jgi:hypothetical protein
MKSATSPAKPGRVLTLDGLVYGHQHDLFTDRLGQIEIRNLGLGIPDLTMQAILAGRVTRQLTREAFGEVSPFRQPRLSFEDLLLSYSHKNRWVGIMASWLCAGFMLVGNTGSGKTTLIEWLTLQVARLAQVRGIWLTDMYKRRLRHVRPLFKRLGRELLVLSPNNLAINPLQALGDPRKFASFISDLFVRVLGLPPRSRTILRSAIQSLYAKFGIFEGRTDNWPVLNDLFIWVQRTEGLNAQSRDAILDRLGALLSSMPAGSAFRRAWSPLDLAEHCLVFELLGLGEQSKTLLMSYCLFALFLYDMQNPGLTGNALRHWLVFEDAQRFFHDGADDSSADMPPFEELAGVVRESGRGLALVVQSLQGFPKGLSANMATKVMGRLGIDDDWQRLGRDMGMSADQIAWSKLSLRPGRFVGQVSEGDWRLPFLMTVPPMTIPKSVTDDEADASVNALSHLPLVRATEYDRWDPFAAIHVDDNDASDVPGVLDDAERRFLQAVIDNPKVKSSDYAAIANMGQRRALEVRRQLVARGYLREHQVATSATGRAAIVLEPLPGAYDVLGLQQPCNEGVNI